MSVYMGAWDPNAYLSIAQSGKRRIVTLRVVLNLCNNLKKEEEHGVKRKAVLLLLLLCVRRRRKRFLEVYQSAMLICQPKGK